MQALLRMLYLGQNVKEAVDARRLHHQLFPMNLNYEDGITTVGAVDRLIDDVEMI